MGIIITVVAVCTRRGREAAQQQQATPMHIAMPTAMGKIMRKKTPRTIAVIIPADSAATAEPVEQDAGFEYTVHVVGALTPLLVELTHTAEEADGAPGAIQTQDDWTEQEVQEKESVHGSTSGQLPAKVYCAWLLEDGQLLMLLG